METNVDDELHKMIGNKDMNVFFKAKALELTPGYRAGHLNRSGNTPFNRALALCLLEKYVQQEAPPEVPWEAPPEVPPEAPLPAPPPPFTTCLRGTACFRYIAQRHATAKESAS